MSRPDREAQWMPVSPQVYDEAYEVMLGPDIVVRAELEDVIRDPFAVRARRWQIRCGGMSLTATWLYYANFQFALDDEPISIYWSEFLRRGEIEFPEGERYCIEQDGDSKFVLQSVDGRLLTVLKSPWKDSHLRKGVRWVSHVRSEIGSPYAGLAAGLLCILLQVRYEMRMAASEELAPFPTKKKVAAKKAEPPFANPLSSSPLLGTSGVQAEGGEIPWLLREERVGIHIVRADFPKGLVKVERLRQGLFNPYGRLTRCEIGDWIAAVENTTSDNPTIHSSEAPISVSMTPHPDGSGVSSAVVEFAGGDVFQLVRHEVAGWRVSCNGRSIARHALPWKDSHQKARAQWVTYLETADYPWPSLGMALALLDIMRARMIVI